jgi:hypothetical protein
MSYSGGSWARLLKTKYRCCNYLFCPRRTGLTFLLDQESKQRNQACPADRAVAKIAKKHLKTLKW